MELTIGSLQYPLLNYMHLSIFTCMKQKGTVIVTCSKLGKKQEEHVDVKLFLSTGQCVAVCDDSHYM